MLRVGRLYVFDDYALRIVYHLMIDKTRFMISNFFTIFMKFLKYSNKDNCLYYVNTLPAENVLLRFS